MRRAVPGRKARQHGDDAQQRRVWDTYRHIGRLTEPPPDRPIYRLMHGGLGEDLTRRHDQTKLASDVMFDFGTLRIDRESRALRTA